MEETKRAREIFERELSDLQEEAQGIVRSRKSGKVKFYKKPFTPVSVTGTRCEMSCKHCDKHYLEHMIPADDPSKLEKAMRSLKSEGVNGIVLSGGSRRDGSVPTYELAEEILRLKKETGMKINAHTGIVSCDQAKKLSLFLDAALTDVIGDRETVSEILGLDYGPSDYEKTLTNLRDAGVPNISPHVIVGLRYGRISGELSALDMLRNIDPQNIVIVVCIPTKGTPMASCKPAAVGDIAKIIATARIMYPGKDISLSCVRPGGRYRIELDSEALKSGVNKLVLPTRKAYETAACIGLEIEEINESRCCSW